MHVVRVKEEANSRFTPWGRSNPKARATSLILFLQEKTGWKVLLKEVETEKRILSMSSQTRACLLVGEYQIR